MRVVLQFPDHNEHVKMKAIPRVGDRIEFSHGSTSTWCVRRVTWRFFAEMSAKRKGQRVVLELAE